MGAIAVAVALGNNVLVWRHMQSENPPSRADGWLFFPGIALVLLLWLFSRMLSDGKCRLGGLAVAVLALGPLALALIHDFIR